MDKILIRGLRIFAHHGVNPEEKRDGQLFELDVTLSLSTAVAAISDDVTDTVHYGHVIKLITITMQETSCDLIERAANRVARAVLVAFSPVQRVTVRLHKPNAPIDADFAYVGVEITRERSDYEY